MPEITNHAVVRYLERFEFMDIEAIRRMIKPTLQWLDDCIVDSASDHEVEMFKGIRGKMMDEGIIQFLSRQGVDIPAKEQQIRAILSEIPEQLLRGIDTIRHGKITYRGRIYYFRDRCLTTMYFKPKKY